ncbi:hypothetical protein B296_00051932 [Ensete ventricosum]|uniref:Uncharacterized protein n=1 Tax=Ensete ventricosum TaxID=4639 RepID=A0A426XBJ9_ENSVE|nr:hypothetical protein B296_00051932 [Ensete ventricosum]
MYRPYRTVRTGPPGYRYVDRSLSGGTAKIDRRRYISAIGGRLREKKGRRRRGKEERRGEERIPRAVLARAPSPPVGHPRAVTILANGSPMSRRRLRSQFFSRAGRKIDITPFLFLF